VPENGVLLPSGTMSRYQRTASSTPEGLPPEALTSGRRSTIVAGNHPATSLPLADIEHVGQCLVLRQRRWFLGSDKRAGL
jgi:hypothetical protein